MKGEGGMDFWKEYIRCGEELEPTLDAGESKALGESWILVVGGPGEESCGWLWGD